VPPAGRFSRWVVGACGPMRFQERAVGAADFPPIPDLDCAEVGELRAEQLRGRGGVERQPALGAEEPALGPSVRQDLGWAWAKSMLLPLRLHRSPHPPGPRRSSGGGASGPAISEPFQFRSGGRIIPVRNHYGSGLHTVGVTSLT